MSRFGPIAGDGPDHGVAHASDFSGPLPADLMRAVGWLRGHLSDPVQLGVLAQVAGVRPRTLETHFKMFLGTTPLGWVRRTRLARARQNSFGGARARR
jgi:transcriptional regulator GlxA family with amidase domain